MTYSAIFICFSIFVKFSIGFPAETLLSTGEGIQSLGRILNIEGLEKYGIDTDIISPRIKEDAFLTVPQLITKYGYPLEVHKVQSPDGYILEMHRIPKPGGIPVYLQHGILDSSAGWVIMGPHSSLAYLLADRGYDVWMGNVRGNRYSRNHIYLNPNRRGFWDFSFHEIGTFDIPAMLDHILDKTQYKKVHYVAHSQGTTNFWVMCSQRPGHCDKIISMNALAPVAFMQYIRSPMIKAVTLILDQIEFLAKLMGMNEFLPSSDLMAMAGQLLCKEEAITQALCFNTIFLITGYNTEQLNKTMLPAILGHVPAGAATKQFIHYGQLVKSKKFRMFDYGLIKNLRTYGKFRPPAYDLSKVEAPVALHYSMNDWLADPKDVFRLEEQLPNVIGRYLVPLPKFNHLDFLFAIRSRELVYNPVLKIMKDMENKTSNIK